MSIIGIVWFSLSLICMSIFSKTDIMAALGWGCLAILYALPFSIVVLVKSNKMNNSIFQKLERLNDLKEKGILSEDEFQVKKMDLLKN